MRYSTDDFNIEDIAPELAVKNPLPCMVIDKKGIVKSCTPTLSTFSGFEIDEILGSDLKKMLPDHVLGIHDKLIEKFFKNTSTRQMESDNAKVSLKRKNGSLVPVTIILIPVKNSTYCGAIIIDTSKMQTLIEDLKKANEDLSNQVSEKYDYDLEMAKTKQKHEFEMKSLVLVLATVVVLCLSVIFYKGIPEGIAASILTIATVLITQFLSKIVTSKTKE